MDVNIFQISAKTIVPTSLN